jgi:hypothetical protein
MSTHTSTARLCVQLLRTQHSFFPKAHVASQARQGSADLLARRLVLLLLALNPGITGAQRELLQVRCACGAANKRLAIIATGGPTELFISFRRTRRPWCAPAWSVHSWTTLW